MANSKTMTAMETAELFKANTHKTKDKGIGYAWGNLTGAIGNVSGMIGEASEAGRIVAQNAVQQASQSRVESAIELCESMGYPDVKGAEALLLAKALTDFISSQ